MNIKRSYIHSQIFVAYFLGLIYLRKEILTLLKSLYHLSWIVNHNLVITPWFYGHFL